jgi:hypothetical protein
MQNRGASEFLATDPVVRVRLTALPDFLKSNVSATGFTQPREYSYWKEKNSGSVLQNREYGRKGSAEVTTSHPLSSQKLALTSPTSFGRSVSSYILHISDESPFNLW